MRGVFSGMKSVPFVMYRSGTSRGPFFLESDVPPRGPERDAVLCSIMGSGHPSQLEGLGGGSGPTSKAVIVGPGETANSVTYTFSQCRVQDASIDHSHGDCGNMLAAVAPFALECALVNPSASGKSRVGIHSLNTGARYEALVDTTGPSRVQYQGDYAVPGVPSLGCPVELTTHGVVGSQTGQLLPTGSAVNEFVLGKTGVKVEATLIDFARALIVLDGDQVMAALALSRPLSEASTEILQGEAVCSALEHVRQEAALAMGMGDCRGKDSPKIALVSRAAEPGTIVCRYYVNPERCEVHPTIAMTAAQALGAAAMLQHGVVRHAMAVDPVPDRLSEPDPVTTHFSFSLQHAKGTMPVVIGTEEPGKSELFPLGVPCCAKYTTTVLPIAEGRAFVPSFDR